LVRTVNQMPARNSRLEGRPFVVEIIGPAAAGKTTLSRALTQSNEKFVKGTELGLRKIWPIPLFIRHFLLLLPTFLREYENGGRFTWNDIKMIVSLNGWMNVYRRQAANGKIIVLDLGPIFMLAHLHRSRAERTMSRRFDRWWGTMLKQWALILEMVIWLEAPEEILLERRHARNRSRIERGEKTEEEAAKSLVGYLRPLDFEGTISAMAAIKATRLLSFNTDQYSVSQIENKVTAAFGLGHDQGRILETNTSRV